MLLNSITSINEELKKFPDAINLAMGDILPTLNQLDERLRSFLIEKLNESMPYSPVKGEPWLKRAVCEYVRERDDADISENNVVVTAGAMGGLFTAMRIILDGEKNEVITPNPSWEAYSYPIKTAGGVQRKANFFDGGRFSVEKVLSSITPRTAAVLINSPENPTGRIIPHKCLLEIAKHLNKSGVALISDEVYNEIVYEGEKTRSCTTIQPLDNVFVINSISKNFAMTGFRVGWVIADSKRLDKSSGIVRGAMTCVPRFCQHAAAYAIEHSRELLPKVKSMLGERRREMYKVLSDVFDLNMPEGGIYFWGATKPDEGDIAFAEKLLYGKHVGIIPGTFFGDAGRGHFRISFGVCNTSQIRELGERLQKEKDML
jgi:aspartate/methionine/tyrosine aminotransferase